jgi:hypothetical protein
LCPPNSDHFSQQLEERNSVSVGEEDPAAIIAAVGDVVECAFELDSQWASHAESLALGTPKNIDLPPSRAFPSE